MSELSPPRPAPAAAPEPASASASRSGPHHRPSIGAVLLPSVGLLVALCVWWLLTSVLRAVHPVVLPPPGAVLAAFSAAPGRFLEHTGDTTVETLVGFVLSTVCGVLIGLSLAGSRLLERMFTPLLVAVNAVPKIALGPLLVGALGWGQTPVLTMVFLLCFFPIVLSTATGLTSTPADLAELARSLDASRWQAFRKVRLPAALPQIFVGLKVAMPLAAIGAVIGEFQAGESGLGYLIVQAGGVGDTATAWAAIILIGLMSILLYFALVVMERFALPWVRETTSRG
ncbi:ABC transporter permease [Streptomyces sp. AK02-01A]|uniref:ABC transporter permease n=1 Tax=Streptomyces sp. AK02-01A TaxID=3028648 RepID=UPI0029A0BF8B|nr:ABC transporter permease [Streptomyces sp. AK02-01A]MDX3850262.1 ABC transporter permease [Streptomyces sp. AK02-01A]